MYGGTVNGFSLFFRKELCLWKLFIKPAVASMSTNLFSSPPSSKLLPMFSLLITRNASPPSTTPHNILIRILQHMRWHIMRRVNPHCPKFQNLKIFFMYSNSILLKNNGPGESILIATTIKRYNHERQIIPHSDITIAITRLILFLYSELCMWVPLNHIHGWDKSRKKPISTNLRLPNSEFDNLILV